MVRRILMAAMLVALCGCQAAERPVGETQNTSEASVEDVAENATDVVDASQNAAGSADNAANAASNASNAEIWCGAARAYLSATDCRALEIQRDSLEQGVAAFNPPRSMMRGEATRVVLAIGPKAEESEVAAAAGGDASAVRVAPVRIGRYMTASLSGSAFTIAPVGNPQRDLGLSASEQWEWDVTPTREGAQTLQVRIETFAQDGRGNRTRIRLDQSPPVSVDVQVTDRERRSQTIGTIKGDVEDTTGLLKSLGAWLLALAGVIGALALVIWRIRGLGKKPEEGDGGSEDDKSAPPAGG